MARLISLDDAVDAMKKSICGDTYEVDKAIEAIENITPVEAIPIEWIENYIFSLIFGLEDEPIHKRMIVKFTIGILDNLMSRFKEEQDNEQSEEGSEVE